MCLRYLFASVPWVSGSIRKHDVKTHIRINTCCVFVYCVRMKYICLFVQSAHIFCDRLWQHIYLNIYSCWHLTTHFIKRSDEPTNCSKLQKSRKSIRCCRRNTATTIYSSLFSNFSMMRSTTTSTWGKRLQHQSPAPSALFLRCRSVNRPHKSVSCRWRCVV